MPDPISIKTQGITITVSTDGGTTRVPILGHDSITGLGGGSSSELDETTMASLAKEFRQGLQDNGTVTIGFSRRNHDDPGQAKLFTMRSLQQTGEFQVTFPEGVSDVTTFDAWVMSFTKDAAKDDLVRGTLTLRVTGVYDESTSP